LLAFLYIVVPMGIALTETHKYREPIGSPPGADYREVRFQATDGVDLSGWYRPARNGATILVVHGGGGDRTGAVAHAKLLVRHGYGVLLYDARGRGKSEGVQNAYGWGWPKDIAGAIRFLTTRDEVNPEHIGALGLSTGADVLIQVAGQGTELKAVVADGTYPGSFEDPERDAGEVYDRAAGNRPVDVWYLPDLGHTAANREAAPEYEQRVTAFFDAALAGR
jgi:dipeptidyl aminopeptidase/acylaminoacyl peptidase